MSNENTDKPRFDKVLKFGGASVGSAEAIPRVCEIIARAWREGRIAVVVSAMAGMTDKLLNLRERWVVDLYLQTAKKLGLEVRKELIIDLEKTTEAIRKLKDLSSKSGLDAIAVFGELLTADLVANCFNQKFAASLGVSAVAMDAREFIKTNDNFGCAAVNIAMTKQLVLRRFGEVKGIPIVTGFIGSTPEGRSTTLGRNGSDYSATLLGALLGVKTIEIWKDVPGIMSADPKLVAKPILLRQVSYEEAMEIATGGAKVIHPLAMLPAMNAKIPIVIKSVFSPDDPGTIITEKTGETGSAVKIISVIPGIRLISIGGTNFAGVPGTAARVFQTLASDGINVIFISQASSEHTICVGVKESDWEAAIARLTVEFKNESQEIKIESRPAQAVISLIGDNMRGAPGTAGKVFTTLGEAGVNVSAIAQGASECNISIVIDEHQVRKTLQFLHRRFVEKDYPAGIFLFGLGNVGQAFLQLLSSRAPLGLKLFGLANSKELWLWPEGIAVKDATDWRKFTNGNGVANNLGDFLAAIRDFPVSQTIFVDCTASAELASRYPQIIAAGCHLVAANKYANIAPTEKCLAFRKILAESGRYFLYSANVGAGLPIISTLRRLTETGDSILKVEGIFSGTLGYLLSRFDGARPFSELVQEAQHNGYTEPDPNQDLSGSDVAVKLLILARELGLHLELKDIKVQSLIQNDDWFAARLAEAQRAGAVLRYIGIISTGQCRASLEGITKDSVLARTSGAENIVVIHSAIRSRTIIAGLGAGAEVTATAVLSDIQDILTRVSYS